MVGLMVHGADIQDRDGPLRASPKLNYKAIVPQAEISSPIPPAAFFQHLYSGSSIAPFFGSVRTSKSPSARTFVRCFSTSVACSSDLSYGNLTRLRN